MGKKGSWFSAIKRVFTHNSKEKPTNGPDNRNSKEKKKGKGVLRHSETKSFIPLFREPSSIEKILGEADEILTRPPAFSDNPKAPTPLLERPTPQTAASPRIASNAASSPKAKVSSPRAASPKPRSPRVTSPKPVFPKNDSLEADPPRIFSPGAASSKAAAPKVMQNRKEVSYVQRPDPTLRHRHLSATKIQAAYRGYVARRSFRALRGLVRLQGVVRGQNVKRQTMNAMKQMQLLVRVQTQIQSRRIQMLENQALENQAHKNDKEMESTLSKWTQLTEAGNDDWDDSSLTKEELEARMQKKVEAVIKRERAMAYAYSHQLWKSNPKSVQSSLDIRSNGYPWWWNWLERQLPPTSTSQSHKNINITPPRPISENKPSPRPHASNYVPTPNNFTFDNNEALTPRSSKSSVPVRSKPLQTPGRTPSPGFMKNSKTRASVANSAYDAPLKDDDSLMSCPPFSAPNYMTPTVSAKAKVRANSNPKERLLGTPSNDSKRRFSFPLTPNIGSFKWSKGSNKDSSSQKVLESQKSPRSIGNMSIDSAVSMPSLVGRKPFNRFV